MMRARPGRARGALQRRARLRIEAQQIIADGSPGARQSDDNQGSTNILARYLGIFAVILDEAKPRGQLPHYVMLRNMAKLVGRIHRLNCID